MPARNLEFDAERARRRRDPHPAGSRVVQPDGGVVGGSVQHHAGVAAGQGALGQCPGPGVVSARHQDAVRREQGREAVEGGIDGLGGAVEVQVVRLDVGHHGDRGAVVQEGAVRLVGLGDEDARRAVCRVDSERRDVGADREGRVQSGALQQHRDHGGRGGLAVRSGDCHHSVIRHRGGQRLGAVQHRESGGAGRCELGVVGPDRGAGDHRLGVSQVAGSIADGDPRPGGREVRHDGQRLGVGAAHRDAAGHHDAGNGGHADAADADEVDAAEGFQGMRAVLGLGHCSTASCRAGSCPAVSDAAVSDAAGSRCARSKTRRRG